MVQSQTEGIHNAAFEISRANGTRSIENKTLEDPGADTEFSAGTVLGTVTASGEVKALVPAAADGSETASGILINTETVLNTETPEVAIFARDGEVNDQELVWPAGITQPQKNQAIIDLAAIGIVVRAEQPA